MKPTETIFVIPTYRLRDVAETVEAYDRHFHANGHAVKLMVFDDSSLANHDKYYGALERTKTHNEVFYVGPREKEQFMELLNRRLRDRKLELLVRNLFRPSYGGNRNFTLMYTLGRHMVSAAAENRRRELGMFAENLAKAFYGFEPDFFQQNVSRIVDDVVSQFHASLEIWPTLVEICYFLKDKQDLPQRLVANRRLKPVKNRTTSRALAGV